MGQMTDDLPTIDALVKVVCDAHAKRPRHVRTFILAGGSWGEAMPADEDAQERVTVRLVGRVPWSSGKPIDLADPRVFEGVDWDVERIRYDLRCPVHRTGARAVTAQRLHPILDEIATRGENEVTLARLGAMLDNS